MGKGKRKREVGNREEYGEMERKLGFLKDKENGRKVRITRKTKMENEKTQKKDDKDEEKRERETE